MNRAAIPQAKRVPVKVWPRRTEDNGLGIDLISFRTQHLSFSQPRRSSGVDLPRFSLLKIIETLRIVRNQVMMATMRMDYSRET